MKTLRLASLLIAFVGLGAAAAVALAVLLTPGGATRGKPTSLAAVSRLTAITNVLAEEEPLPEAIAQKAEKLVRSPATPQAVSLPAETDACQPAVPLPIPDPVASPPTASTLEAPRSAPRELSARPTASIPLVSAAPLVPAPWMPAAAQRAPRRIPELAVAERPAIQAVPTTVARSTTLAIRTPGDAVSVAPAPAFRQQVPGNLNSTDLENTSKLLQDTLQKWNNLGNPEAVPTPDGKPGTGPALAPPAASKGRPTRKPPLPGPDDEGPPPAHAADRGDPEGPTLQLTPLGNQADGRFSLHVQGEDIRNVLDLLGEQGNLNILASKNVAGKVTVTLRDVDVNTAMTAILRSTGFACKREGKFLYVGSPDELESMEHTLDQVTTRVYRPNYITAADMQALIQPMITEKVGAVSVSSPAEAGIAASADNAGGNKISVGDVVVVRDYEAVLTQIDQVVAEVDVRPMQVAIESMILDVKLDDKNSMGVDWQFLRNQNTIKFGLGNPPDTLANFTFQDGALKFGFLDSSLGAFISALETVGDTNVVASPRLMVLNKQRADILIGQQLGYVSTTTTETSSTQTVSFLDVGAQLRLRPYISADGLIRMEVHPELSTGSVTTQGNVTIPNKEVTQVTTNIMVRDGMTVIIGGLMREDLAKSANEVPLLGSLPGVGFLFRSTTDETQKHEIIVLITPHIVYEPESGQEGEKAACEFHRRQAVAAEKMAPLGRDALSRRYVRLARNAWAAGNRDAALRFAEMAVEFSPSNRAAIELRSQIWQGKGRTEAMIDGTRAAAMPSAVDGEKMADWVLNDLEHPQPAALHPLDRGVTGRHQDVVRPEKLQSP